MCHASSARNFKFCICHVEDPEQSLDLVTDPLSPTLAEGCYDDVGIEGYESLVTLRQKDIKEGLCALFEENR